MKIKFKLFTMKFKEKSIENKNKKTKILAKPFPKLLITGFKRKTKIRF